MINNCLFLIKSEWFGKDEKKSLLHIGVSIRSIVDPNKLARVHNQLWQRAPFDAFIGPSRIGEYEHVVVGNTSETRAFSRPRRSWRARRCSKRRRRLRPHQHRSSSIHHSLLHLYDLLHKDLQDRCLDTRSIGACCARRREPQKGHQTYC